MSEAIQPSPLYLPDDPTPRAGSPLYHFEPTIHKMQLNLRRIVKVAIKWALKPSNVILVAGKKRTGKSHILAWFTWYAVTYLNKIVLTNMVYKQRQPDGTFKMCYPPGVIYCNSLMDVMLHTSHIIAETDKTVLVIMDELQNFMNAYEWNSPLGKDFILFLGIISKLKQTYMLAQPDIKLFPRGLKDPDADTTTALFYKDIEHTYDFNYRAGRQFKTKEIMFVERPGCKKEVWKIGVCPWARPESEVQVGEFVYDHLVPGSRFTLGEIGHEYVFDFRRIVAKTEHVIAEDIPSKLIEWATEIETYRDRLKMAIDSRSTRRSILDLLGGYRLDPMMPLNDRERRKIERDILIPYFAIHCPNVPVSSLVNNGMIYSDAQIYNLYKKVLDRPLADR